ncbi:Histone-lysine N-methyltransferase ASH1L [Merluccius polli]|uniref:Histone-lysine N-methyltransferase ASH1L n=1 Tax=Merluccius polli TaxID=89951 RepID=A0AA47P7A8_MERPO|nr:Histone-lysine N-methyltransferase ASH1L [Merluccius polli]
MRSEYGRRRVTRGEAECEGAPAACRPQEATVNTLSALSPLGDKWGAQINVSKRGTIYMGKRRGRKPKAPAGTLNSPLNAHRPPQPPLFTSLSESSLFASHQLQPPAAHPFPSPSLTHSSGAQSPYSEGSFTDPTSTSSSLVFPHPFSLPSPSSSCTSPHPPPPTSSSSLSPFVKKSCPCQGRLHFPFHQSSCKLSALAPPLHHSPTSPAHLKEAIPSPRSESHSEETLPSDSGIGTDNNSVSERGGEMRGGRGVFRMGPGSGLILGGQRYPTALAKRPSPVASHLASVHRHAHPIASPAAVERQRERHRHRRRDFDCVSSCSCMCSCPCQGPNKCTHVDSYPCLGHSAMKKQKSKHKKKHQQLHMHDPEFLAELEDLIGQFGEVHIGRRGWVRSGLGPGLEGGVKVDGGRRHHPSSSHPMRSNIFRINLNGFYSPHSSAYSTNPSYGPQPFYPCQPLHCGRKPDRRQCGCPSKFQDTMDDMSFYRGYPPTVPIYPHLHSSYPLPPPHQYVSHQPHHPHFLLNPARFHRRMGRVMRDGGPGAEGEGDVGRAGGGGGGQRPGAGFASALGCGCSRAEHKHKRKHRHHQRCDPNEEEEDAEEEEGMPGDPGLAGPKPQPGGYVPGPADGGRKAQRDSPWLRKNVRETFSSTATGMTSLPRLSSERFKQTPLTSLGLGSSHLSSFGGSWGGLGQPWMKIGASGHPGFSLSNPSWSTSASSKHAERSEGSDPEEEDDDEDEYQDSHLYAAPRSPTHINLFTSAAMETGRKGLRIGKEGPGVGEMSWRREDLAWRERRGTGLQGDPRRRGTQKGVPAAAAAAAVAAATDGAEVRKRGPGRPRKYPLPVPAPPSSLSSSSPPPPPPSLSSSSSSTYPFTAPLQSPEAARSRIDVVGERLAEGTAAQTGDSGLAAGAKRKRGRKRKHADSPCRRSLSDDKPDSDDPAEYFDQSETEQLSPHTSSVQWERRVDSYPSKSFLNSGLYSDDHKTTDSPTESNPTSRASVEYTAGEREYSLLPAPLHVGKYLRLKRIDFQLPYDVLWLWRHNQLHRQPAVPLKRKRHYCRLKGRTRVSHHELEECSGDMAALFPHLEMEPMTSTERSFVVKQRVFLVRNWEAVRDKQIHLRMERERRRQRAESDAAHRARSGDHGNIQSDEPLGSDEMVISRVPHSRTSDTSSSLTAYPHLTKPQNRREETGEEDKTQEEEDEDEEEEEEEEEEDNEVCRRELRKKRLNDLLLALQHP